MVKTATDTCFKRDPVTQVSADVDLKTATKSTETSNENGGESAKAAFCLRYTMTPWLCAFVALHKRKLRVYHLVSKLQEW